MLLPMRSKLVELEKAIDDKNVLKMHQATGAMMGPLGALYNEPRPTDAVKQKNFDSLAGPCVVLISRCQTKLAALPPETGLHGVVFDSDPIASVLMWAMTLIVPPGTRPPESTHPADAPTPMEFPKPPEDAEEGYKPG